MHAYGHVRRAQGMRQRISGETPQRTPSVQTCEVRAQGTRRRSNAGGRRRLRA